MWVVKRKWLCSFGADFNTITVFTDDTLVHGLFSNYFLTLTLDVHSSTTRLAAHIPEDGNPGKVSTSMQPRLPTGEAFPNSGVDPPSYRSNAQAKEPLLHLDFYYHRLHSQSKATTFIMSSTSSSPRRIGQLVYLKPECLEEYKKCHAAVWPEVLEQIKDSNIVDCT